MKTTSKFLWTLLLSSLFLVSCNNDDDGPNVIEPDPEPEQPEGKYDDGLFVLNEGSQSAGTVTYISDDLQTVEQQVFQTVNGGEDLGIFVQSIFFDGDLAYIISNGSNLITVVNRYTFEKVGLIDSGLNVPYYGVAENGKAYVVNLAAFDTGEDDYLAVIDLETLEVEENIIIGNYSDSIIEENGKIYIENSEYTGATGSISVFDPATNQIETTIETEPGLNSFEIEDNKLYALSGNALQRFDVSSLELENTVELTYEASAGNLTIEDNTLYFTAGNMVYTMLPTDEVAPDESMLSHGANFLYGFEVEDSRVYVADGGDFVSNSYIEIYDLNGNLLKKIDVGIGPNGFYFND